METIKYNDYSYLDIYEPEKANNDVIIFFHGGGLIEGKKEYLYDIALDFFAKGYTFIAPEYRMMNIDNPDDSHYFEDCADAVKYVFERYKNKNIYVGGHSAGGYLSMMICFDDNILSRVSLKPSNIKGYLFLSGQPTTHFNYLHFKGIDSRRVIVDKMAPLYYIDNHIINTKMLFVVSENDLQNRPLQNELMYNTLLHFGYDKSNIKYLYLESEDHGSYMNKSEAKESHYIVDIIHKFIVDINK